MFHWKSNPYSIQNILCGSKKPLLLCTLATECIFAVFKSKTKFDVLEFFGHMLVRLNLAYSCKEMNDCTPQIICHPFLVERGHYFVQLFYAGKKYS